MKQFFSCALSVCACFVLSGCGGLYTSARLDNPYAQSTHSNTTTVQSPQKADNAPPARSLHIQPMQAKSVQSANALAHTLWQPQGLPPVFQPETFVAAHPHFAAQGGGATPVPLSVPTRIPAPTPVPPYRIAAGDVVRITTPVGFTSALTAMPPLLMPTTTTTAATTAMSIGESPMRVARVAGAMSTTGIGNTTNVSGTTGQSYVYRVGPDGNIVIPALGRIRIGGQTMAQAESNVLSAFAEQGQPMVLNLDIASFQAHRMTISGHVRTPQILILTDTILTLEQAIAASNGIVPTLEREFLVPPQQVIYLYRGDETYTIPVAAFMQKTALRQLPLLPNDSVVVTALGGVLPDPQREIVRAQRHEVRTVFEQRIAMGAVARDYVYLAGELVQQGRFALPFEQRATLADALFAQGGFDVRTANVGQIYVLRHMPPSAQTTDDHIMVWWLDAQDASALVLATQFELIANDVIFIAQNPITEWDRLVGQAMPSLFINSARLIQNK